MDSPDKKKIIAIVGATGNQGSSVAHTFLTLPNWHVRCLTRDPSSASAQDMSSKGAQVVQADLSDIDSLSQAFSGAAAIFVNTDFWVPYKSSLSSGADHEAGCKAAFETEVSHGKNAAIAAAGVPTLERFIYSALGPVNRASSGKYSRSLHWESKASIVDYIESEQPELWRKASFIYLGAYSTNDFLRPRPKPQSGEYTLIVPTPRTTRFPIVNPAKSTGPFVRALIEDEDAGTKLLAYDSYLTVGEALDAWSRAVGKEAAVVETTPQAMHGLTGLPMEILEGPAFIGEFGYMAGVAGVVEPPQLRANVKTQSYEDWLRERPQQELL